jgi:ATP-binding cassette subfamily C protein
MEIPAHKISTINGPSGSGKTTIIDLVIGLIRPNGGEILIDGVPFEQIDVKAWRRMVGYVPQETVLLHDSILYNVSLGDPQISEAQVIDALKKAGAWDFVCEMPEGLHTFVGERGGRLSGGQRQRIAIARALINDPRLLILDEATQGLDQPGSAAFYARIAEVRGELGCAVLMVSHELHVVMSASDRVICLNGHVCCEGRPEVVAQADEYRALFGSGTQGALALYRHDHNHAHDPAPEAVE